MQGLGLLSNSMLVRKVAPFAFDKFTPNQLWFSATPY